MTCFEQESMEVSPFLLAHFLTSVHAHVFRPTRTLSVLLPPFSLSLYSSYLLTPLYHHTPTSNIANGHSKQRRRRRGASRPRLQHLPRRTHRRPESTSHSLGGTIHSFLLTLRQERTFIHLLFALSTLVLESPHLSKGQPNCLWLL